MMKIENLCPICGCENNTVVYSPKKGATHEICSCCFIEFGYEDCVDIHHHPDEDERYVHKALRKKWIKEGMKWYSQSPLPDNWNPTEQLKNLIVLEELFEEKVKAQLEQLPEAQYKTCSSGRKIGWYTKRSYLRTKADGSYEMYDKRFLVLHDPAANEHGAIFFPATDLRYFMEWLCPEQLRVNEVSQADRRVLQHCVKQVIEQELVPYDEFVTRIGVRPDKLAGFVADYSTPFSSELAYGIHNCMNEVCYGLWFSKGGHNLLEDWDNTFDITRREMRAVFERWKVRK